jgi:hypothetical protein
VDEGVGFRRQSAPPEAKILIHDNADGRAAIPMSETTTFVLIAVVLAGCGAVGVYLIYSGLKNLRLSAASETWPITGGTVLASDVVTRVSSGKGGKTTYYTPQVRYTYKVGGIEHESGVIRFGDLERKRRALADEMVAKYPAGSTVAVRYDPQSPERATLETVSAGGSQIGAGAFFIIMPLIIVGAGALAFILAEDREANLPPEVLEQINKPN